MASSAKPFSLFLLIIFLSSFQTHARENQFFNKVSTTTNVDNNVVPDATKQPLNNQPNFVPESENSYGLYRHNPGQLPPSAAADAAIAAESKQPADLPKYLPNNYNPVAYVTQPEDTNTFAEEKSYYYNNGGRGGAARNYYYNNNHQEKEEEELPSSYRSYNPTTRNNNNNYYGGGSSFNSQPQGLSDTSFRRGGGGGFQPQGMSDTRSLENGKYFYDINTEKYSSNHPYERSRRARARNEYINRNYYNGNSENVYEFNGENSIDEFQGEAYNLP